MIPKPSKLLWLRDFNKLLEAKIKIPIHLENEALSSVRAESELKTIGTSIHKRRC